MAVIYTFEPPAEGEVAVQVSFVDGDEVVHERKVNAVFTDGVYDADATEVRVSEVARGVTHKLAVKAISKPDPDKDVNPDIVDDKLKGKAKKDAEDARDAKRAQRIAARKAELAAAVVTAKAKAAAKQEQ